MLKVLIVDDEPDICELIHKLIAWKELDLFSIGSVQNGVTAMEIILRQKPDIVISDIQMPGMTGLEMIEKAHQQGLQTSFIVISGYREFEYAQKAIRFGVEEYLLKPINKNDLNLVLRRLIQKKDSLQEQQDYARMMQGELLQKNTILRGNELRQTVLDCKRTFNTELFDFQPGEFLALVVHASLKDKLDLDLVTVSNVLENIVIRVRDRLQESYFDSEYVLDDCNAVFLMNYSESVHCSYRERRDLLQQLLREASVQYQNCRITFALGSPVHSEREIGLAVETAEQAGMLRLYAGSEHIIEHEVLCAKLPDKQSCVISMEQRKQLDQLIETFQAMQAVELMQAAYRKFQHSESYDIWNLFTVTRNLIMHIRDEVVALGLREENSPPLDDGHAVLSEADIHTWLANSDTIPELLSLLCTYIQEEISYCSALQRQRVSEPVRVAQEYVRAHIDRQISLDEVAARAFVSPGYFCTLFKERTGQNFSDYIIEMRVEEAKRLLRQTTHSINEVAELVGYSDARHFSKVFQKNVGVKPTAYRKIYK